MREFLNRYGLARLPFSKELSSEELFDFDKATDLRTRLLAALEGRASAVLTGEAGVGKTFLLRSLEAKLNPSRYKITYIHNAGVNRRDFYRQLSTVLGLEPKANASALFRQVQLQIEELAGEQKVHPILVLDEAHLLPIQVLEHLHVLLNYHKDSRSFLSLLLIGLPELRDRLARNVLSSLSSRLPVRVHLEPLEPKQVGRYLCHRMQTAGCSQEVFSEDAVLSICEATGGVLRRIDVLGQACLEAAYARSATLVDGSTVQQAVRVCAEALR
jgi:type II secretory pathway predicted ATPase ExeA